MTNQNENRPRSGNKQEIQTLREELRQVSERHERGMTEMRQDMAEMKSLLMQLAQTRAHASHPSLQTPVHSQSSVYTPSTLPSPLDRHTSERSTRRSGASRSQKKKHRKQQLRSEDEDDDTLYP